MWKSFVFVFLTQGCTFTCPMFLSARIHGYAPACPACSFFFCSGLSEESDMDSFHCTPQACQGGGRGFSYMAFAFAKKNSGTVERRLFKCYLGLGPGNGIVWGSWKAEQNGQRLVCVFCVNMLLEFETF